MVWEMEGMYCSTVGKKDKRDKGLEMESVKWITGN